MSFPKNRQAFDLRLMYEKFCWETQNFDTCFRVYDPKKGKTLVEHATIRVEEFDEYSVDLYLFSTEHEKNNGKILPVVRVLSNEEGAAAKFKELYWLDKGANVEVDISDIKIIIEKVSFRVTVETPKEIKIFNAPNMVEVIITDGCYKVWEA